jgi:hypothetical protein
MEQERYVYGAGPVPGLPDPLFVVFVEPGRAGADSFYGADPAQVMVEVRAAYPKDRLIELPPVGVPQAGVRISDAMADTIIADLAELVGAAYFRGIKDPALLRRLCRASRDFVRAAPWETGGLLVASFVAAPFDTAEIAVAAPVGHGCGFSLFPGRGAFARMAQSEPGSFSADGSLVLGIQPLPDWAASAARAVHADAVMPEPAAIREGGRVAVDDAQAAALTAVAAAIASGGEGHAGDVRVQLRSWPA